jgi:tetratricopeptide (TPR) repeat protein
LKALKIKKKHYGEDHVEFARTLENFSLTLMSLGEYEKFKDGYMKALEIKKKYFGEYHIEYARSLQNICNALNNLGEYEKAKEGYK